MSATDATPPNPPANDGWAFTKRWGARLLPIVLLAAAGYVIWREVRHISWDEMKTALAAWGPGRIGASLFFVVLSYLSLALNEWAGLRWAGVKIPAATVLFGSFCLNAFAHSLGTAVLVGAAVRLKVYASHRLSTAVIVKTTAFANISFALGLMAMAGGGLLAAPATQLMAVHMPPLLARLGGVGLLVAVAAYVVVCARVRGDLKLLGHTFILPSWPWAVAQILIGFVDNILTVLIGWVLLPAGFVSLATYTGAFSVAVTTGIISSVPGGAGVFEGVQLTVLHDLDRAQLLAALLGYRLFYFIIPLIMAGGMMLGMGKGRTAPAAQG